MTIRHTAGRRLSALAVGLFAAGIATAQMSSGGNTRPVQGVDPSTGVLTFSIEQARGADRDVIYADLAKYGPWDDRNYALTKDDLKYLSPNEADSYAPLPAFYRVELRKANPNLPKEGSAQYPRVAVNGYMQKYGGVLINGEVFNAIRALGDGRYEVRREKEGEVDRSGILPNFLSGEKRMTTPTGAAESAVAINPVNTNLVIAGTNGPGSGQKMWRSSDGGVTWLGPVNLANTCCDPTVGWSPDGTVGYMGALSTVVGSGTNVLFYRSTDNGASWNLTATLSNQNQSDKEYLHVDMHSTSPNLGNVYMAWHDGNVQKFARSTNGGVSFGSVLTLDSTARGIGSDITSDTAGNVYFFFPALSGGTNAKNIRMLKSTNGGASFAAGVNVSATNADFDFPIPAMETRRAFVYVSADVDRSGGTFNNSIYAAWTDTSTTENNNTATANHSVIRVARSRDGGATWTVNTAHPTADVNTVDRFNQWLSVDRNGRVFVMYYDTRHSTSRSGTDIYYSVSTDGGVTWSAGTRLTTVTSRNISDTFEWGDYNGMDAAINDIMAIYTDNRDESGGTAQSVDVYTIGGFAGGGGNVAPTANFSFTTSGLTATFTDSSSDSDGTIASRSWNFGDGTTSTVTNPSKTYSAAGTYSVQLTVTDNGGLTNSITRSVTVTSGNVAPTANFTFTTSGLTATFTDGSTDSDGTIASRSWNFGDGTTSTATNPSKTYSAAGTYTVQLTVTDNGGLTNSTTRSVTVTSPGGNVLTNGVPVTGLSGATGAELRYTMVVPAGASNLRFQIAGGTGDADLYVRFGTAPTTTTYDCRPFLSGNAETCNIATAQAGTYHVMVRGFSAFSGVSLTGSYSIAGPFFQNLTDFAINDNSTINSPITVTGVAGNAPATLAVAVRILHTYKGDLRVDLVAPDGSIYNLHNRTGAGTDNIIQTFTVNASSEVANGTWNLRVADQAAGDVGTLDSWSMQF
jgi:PKD repeat protein